MTHVAYMSHLTANGFWAKKQNTHCKTIPKPSDSGGSDPSQIATLAKRIEQQPHDMT
jgi:hypothetical protein